MLITPTLLRQMLPYSGDRSVALFSDPLAQALVQYGISTPRRIAAFIGNVAIETESLHLMKELANGAAYQGRMGNVDPGDGEKFVGRGLLQITGRANYTACGKALSLDLQSHPEWLEEPKWACLSGAWFWTTHGCNPLADDDKFGSVVRVINGGFTDLDQRIQCWLTARRALGL